MKYEGISVRVEKVGKVPAVQRIEVDALLSVFVARTAAAAAVKLRNVTTRSTIMFRMFASDIACKCTCYVRRSFADRITL